MILDDFHTVVIGLNQDGVRVGELDLGAAPFGLSLSNALGNIHLRQVPLVDGSRLLYVADNLGVSFLTDPKSDRVLWMHVSLEVPSWRPRNEADPHACYSGRFLMNQKAIPLRPLSVSMANMLRAVELGNVQLAFVPHEKTIAVINISFPVNEIFSTKSQCR
jgi:hypothetical protein